jgi:hypothetical protein
MKPQAELLIIDSIHSKCIAMIAAREDELPAGADIPSLSHQMATTYESGIQALAYNDGDVNLAAADLSDLPTQLHHLGAPMEVILEGIKAKFTLEVEAFAFYFANKEMEQTELIKNIKSILKK